jgi:hypothetical protein
VAPVIQTPVARSAVAQHRFADIASPTSLRRHRFAERRSAGAKSEYDDG